MRIKIIGLLFFFTLAQSLYASSILQINTNQLVNDAELVFEGEVLASRSEQATNGYIVTYVDFQLFDVIKGDVEAGLILTLRFTGGVVGNLKMDVGSRIPKQGERGVYFVESLSRQLTNPLLGWSQGHFRIQQDGSLLAGNNQVVTQFSLDQTNDRQLSQGAAKGVITVKPVLAERVQDFTVPNQPLTLETFKRFIKDLTEK